MFVRQFIHCFGKYRSRGDGWPEQQLGCRDFNRTVPMRKCSEEHACMTSTFSIALSIVCMYDDYFIDINFFFKH